MKDLFAIIGPTASGKSSLAMAIAEEIGGEIVSVDSAQIFLGLDVGTAKPTKEERDRVPHHLIDLIEPTEPYSAAQYAKAAERSIAEIESRNKTPILCGGTGLWLRALVHGLFEVPDIEESHRTLVERGVEFTGAPHRIADMESYELWMAFFRDPDGNPLALRSERPKG